MRTAVSFEYCPHSRETRNVRTNAHAIDRFMDEIRGEGPQVCGVDDAILATRVAFAAIKSVEEHRIVRLAEL